MQLAQKGELILDVSGDSGCLQHAGKATLTELKESSRKLNGKLIKFTLPPLISTASSPDPIEQPADAQSKARILVAEDDPVSRTILSTRLAKWGYDLVITNDGAEA